jgi:transcriptional regulator with XRE-family HTH domain
VHPFGELSARRQELGAALRRLRKSAGLSGEDMAATLGISQSRVSRIELGQQVAVLEVVDNWARAAGASDAERVALLRIAETAAAEMVSRRRAMARGLARLQEDSRELEASARTILNFQTAGIPGLLQVPEYARRTFAAGRQATEAEIAAAVTARMNRQAIVYGRSKNLVFIMTEAAVRWRLGPENLMRAQVQKIIDACDLENVTIGIIPQAAEADIWHDHGFNILDDRADDGGPVVHVETMTRGLTITDPDDVAAYQKAFARLRHLAVTRDDARALLRQIAAGELRPGIFVTERQRRELVACRQLSKGNCRAAIA